jgi:hypothetical protein
LESEEISEEPLDALNPLCNDKGNDIVDNIDEFIHVGRRKWDVIGYDGDPIYDLEGHFQKLPLQLSYEITTNFDIWQQGDDVVADDFQAPKGDLALCSHDDIWSYLEDFDEYSFEHLNLFHEEDYHHRCAQILIKVRTLLSQRRILVTRFSSSLLLLYPMSLKV